MKKLFTWTAPFLTLLCQLTASPSLNQTATISPVHSQKGIPFSISIEEANFQLPNGIQSFAFATHKGEWLFIGGRTNGLHDFNDNNNNFPPEKQNRVVYVINPKTGAIYSRSLSDPSSGLTQKQIDALSVTNAEFFQKNGTLYFIGGYGVDQATGDFNTKKILSALDIKGVIHWVKGKSSSFVKHLRQTSHPLLRVTGGVARVVDDDLSTLLVFGQNFNTFYTPNTNGIYTRQVRRFKIKDDGKKLSVKFLKSDKPDPNYRRRDLNVVPIIWKGESAYAALAGVFTLEGGVWTIPVIVKKDGTSFMPHPKKKAFKQAMNQYNCANVTLYDCKGEKCYVVLMGGLSYGYFENGVFQTDSEIPFTNQVTTLKINNKGHFTQHLMDNEYPVIPSTGSNPGNTLLFGSAAAFIPVPSIPKYNKEILNLNKIKKRTLIGYIIGGIMSTLPNTTSDSDSAASPYIFKVYLQPS